ncbi:MAG: TolC family protein [Acidobacteria bacterium]|nr:TolC family protein [Acidobacteriota bacterium]
MRRIPSIVALVGLLATPAAGRAQSTASDAARTDRVVREAMAAYTDAIKTLTPPELDAQSPTGRASPGGLHELSLEESVQLALEQNLDIQVSRLEPQSVDLQVAGFHNTYRPVLSTTFGQRAVVNPPSSQLNGGTSVNNDTMTYNFGVNQTVPWGGGSYSVGWNNSRLTTNNLFANYNPSYTAALTASYSQPLIRGFRVDNTRQQLEVAQINRDISEESVRATVTQTVANVRNAYWDLVFARSAVDVARRALDLAERLVVDNQARVEVGTLAPLDIVQAQAEAATRRQTLAAAEATASTADLALKRYLVSGTEDPLWRQEIVPVDVPSLEPPPTDVEGAVRRAIAERTDLATSRKNLQSNDVNIRFFKNQSMPALDLTASYGAQGLGGTQFIRQGSGLGSTVIGTVPGGYTDALSLLADRKYPTWNLAVTLSYPLFGNQAEAQHARARVQRQQAQTRLRALEVQVAAEVSNAAFTVQANLRRVEAASVARELAQKRLEAEQSRFEVGLTTNFFVVQAQRDLRDAENTELRALADYRKSLVNFERAQQAPGGSGGGGAITTGGGGS